jgi:hypothetical protein
LPNFSQVDFHFKTQDKVSLSDLDFKEEDKGVQKLTQESELVSAIWLDQPFGNRVDVFVKRWATGEGFVASVYEWR